MIKVYFLDFLKIKFALNFEIQFDCYFANRNLGFLSLLRMKSQLYIPGSRSALYILDSQYFLLFGAFITNMKKLKISNLLGYLILMHSYYHLNYCSYPPYIDLNFFRFWRFIAIHNFE